MWKYECVFRFEKLELNVCGRVYVCEWQQDNKTMITNNMMIWSNLVHIDANEKSLIAYILKDSSTWEYSTIHIIIHYIWMFMLICGNFVLVVIIKLEILWEKWNLIYNIISISPVTCSGPVCWMNRQTDQQT